MYLLYLDDSGSAGNQDEEYLVLGGVSIYEAQAHWITTELDTLAQSIDADDPHSVEFHASEVFSRRRPPWQGMSREEAQGVIKGVLKVLADFYDTARAFAVAIHKGSFSGHDPMQLADHVAYAVFRRYDRGDTQYFDIIAHKFDKSDGVVHGLVHKHNVNANCMCLACQTRRAPA